MEPTTVPKPRNAPQAMLTHERQRVRTAAALARKLYPGPVGEVLSNELMNWEEFGYRFGSWSLMDNLINHLNNELNQRSREGRNDSA